jgi:hypothetical protein
MLLTEKTSVEALIFERLQKGPINTVALIHAIQEVRPRTTKQGVYTALRSLRSKEIIVVHNKRTSFNIRWLKQMGRFFTIAEQYYLTEQFGDSNFLNLKEGDKVTYIYATPVQNDMFWGHALILLSESSIPTSEPVYLYNPHEWFLIARQESEKETFNIISQKRRLLLLCGGDTYLDRAIKIEFDGNKSQYHMLQKPLFKKKNYYLNIVGDFIIEAWIDIKVAEELEDIYKTTAEISDDVRKKILATVEKRGKTKFSISRNARKSEKLKKLFRKFFYIPKES